MTAKNYGTYLQALMAAGLSREQARVYEPLIRQGPMQAGRLAKRSGLSRTYTYRILDELAALGLVTKEEPPGKPAQFIPMHPFAVQELVRKRREEAEVARETVESVMGSLISDYTASSHVPGVRILPGLEGLKEMYQDCLKENKNRLLIRSVLDDTRPEILDTVIENVAKQVARGLKTRALTPQSADPSVTDAELIARDKKNLTERRILPRNTFDLPAQIIIYGDKVAITSYEEPLITTIIENRAIRETMAKLFELLWASGRRPTVS